MVGKVVYILWEGGKRRGGEDGEIGEGVVGMGNEKMVKVGKVRCRKFILNFIFALSFFLSLSHSVFLSLSLPLSLSYYFSHLLSTYISVSAYVCFSIFVSV